MTVLELKTPVFAAGNMLVTLRGVLGACDTNQVKACEIIGVGAVGEAYGRILELLQSAVSNRANESDIAEVLEPSTNS